jgi:hypothetical protein
MVTGTHTATNTGKILSHMPAYSVANRYTRSAAADYPNDGLRA